MSEAKIEAYFFTAFFIGVLVVVGVLFYPFLGALVVALVLATLANPLYYCVLHKLNNKTLSALLVVSIVTLAIVLPAVGLVVLFVQELFGVHESIQTVDMRALPAFFESLQNKVVEVVPFLGTVEYGAMLQNVVSDVGRQAAMFVAGTADVLIKIVVTIIALYYFLKDGRSFLLGFIEMSPLSDEEDVQIINKLKEVSYSLIRGTLVIAVLQGILTGIGFLLFGVPYPVLGGGIAAVSALIPTVGIGIVTIPAFAYLLFTGHMVGAIGFALWAILIAGLVDNMLGPKLIGDNARIHPLFILLSVLGGLFVFGVAGFLIGPLVFGLLVALLEMYKVKIKRIHAQASM